MLLAVALIIFGWSSGSLYIYLEKKYPQYKEKIYFVFIAIFSAGALLVLVAWLMLGTGNISLSDLWK
jgi:hypothetical protein